MDVDKIVKSTLAAASFRPTEGWAAELFTAQHGAEYRFDHTSKSWLFWSGSKWAKDERGAVFQHAAASAKGIKELIAADTDGKTAQELLRFSLSCENRRRLENILTLAATDPNIAVVQSALDADGMVLNCQNGTIDLQSFSFREHRREDHLTKICNAAYNETATCPKWTEFLRWASCDDSDWVRHMAQFVGVCLTAEPLQHLWFWYGLGKNGKSVAWNTIADFLGDYTLKAPFDMLTREAGNIPNDVARLKGARMVVCSEIPSGSSLNEALVKELTGGDRLTARFLRCDFFEFLPSHKLAIVGNHRPRIKGGDAGVWRRLLLIPFDATVSEEQRRSMVDMLAEFKAEYSGILNWALAGLRDYQSNGLTISERSRVAAAEYRDSEDVLADFLAEVEQHPNATATGKALYEAYVGSVASGRPMGQRAFYEALRERGYTIRRTMCGALVEGLAVKQPAPVGW